MKIIVCIKQVPDTKGGVKFNPDGTLDRGAMLNDFADNLERKIEELQELKTK